MTMTLNVGAADYPSSKIFPSPGLYRGAGEKEFPMLKLSYEDMIAERDGALERVIALWEQAGGEGSDEPGLAAP
jgi:hypothetical protein